MPTTTTAIIYDELTDEQRIEWEQERLTLAGIPETEWDHHRVLRNGAIFSNDTHRIVANPGGGIKAITSATSKELRQIADQRRIQGRLAAQEGLARIETASGRTPNILSAWANIVAEQGRLALDTQRGKASTDAARFVGSATGFMGADQLLGAQDAGADTVSLPRSVLTALGEYLRERETVTVDADFHVS